MYATHGSYGRMTSVAACHVHTVKNSEHAVLEQSGRTVDGRGHDGTTLALPEHLAQLAEQLLKRAQRADVAAEGPAERKRHEHHDAEQDHARHGDALQ